MKVFPVALLWIVVLAATALSAQSLSLIHIWHILRFFSQYYKPALAILIGLAVIGTVLTLIQYLRYKKK